MTQSIKKYFCEVKNIRPLILLVALLLSAGKSIAQKAVITGQTNVVNGSTIIYTIAYINAITN